MTQHTVCLHPSKVEIQVLAGLFLQRRRQGNQKFAYKLTFSSFKNIFTDFCFEVKTFPYSEQSIKKKKF
jgi:hypothetical protein